MHDAAIPLRKYVNEVNLWERGTSIEHSRKIALLIANLHGTARSYIETLMLQPINAEQMTYGATINNGQFQVSGPTIMCWWLMQTYGEDEQHTLIRVASELRSFRRMPNESVLESLQRHELLLQSVHSHGVAHENVLIHTLDLLGAMNVTRGLLPHLLIHNHGRLPTTIQAFNTMKTLMVNWGHLLESSGPNSVSSLSVSNDPRIQAFSAGCFQCSR